MSTRYFTPGLFAFLRALAANNDRDWFHSHKEGAQIGEPSCCDSAQHQVVWMEEARTHELYLRAL